MTKYSTYLAEAFYHSRDTLSSSLSATTMISLANDCDRGVRDDGDDDVMTVNAGKHFMIPF